MVSDAAARIRLLPNVAQIAITADWPDGLKEPCIIWPRGTTGRYGVVRINVGQPRTVPIGAHRHAFQFTFGFLDSRFVCHRCDNPICISLFHLFIANQKENIADMFRKGRARPTGPRGAANPSSIYSEAQVLEMRSLRRNGARVMDIQKQFGGARPTVWAVLTRRSWSHI